jgi:hypothetical protein
MDKCIICQRPTEECLEADRCRYPGEYCLAADGFKDQEE